MGALYWSGVLLNPEAHKQSKSDGERERESYSLHEQPIWSTPPPVFRAEFDFCRSMHRAEAGVIKIRILVRTIIMLVGYTY